MKYLYNLFFLLVIFSTSVTIIDCKKTETKDSLEKVNKPGIPDSLNNEITNADIIGNWSNILDSGDVIKILDDSTFNRWDFSSADYLNFYKYHIKTDSIIIHYYGIYKVGTPPYHRKIFLNRYKDSLTIKDFGSVWPCYRGDTFVRISK